jgi:hypothetical protein
MGREQHTIITEGATLTMAEELFKPSPKTENIVGCCRDLYLESLNTFAFALAFSSKVGVYNRRQGIPGVPPTPVAEGLTHGFESRLEPFGDVPNIVITVPHTLAENHSEVVSHILTINATFRANSNQWEDHLIREVWMFSLDEAQKKGIHQSETQLDNSLDSKPELEEVISPEYVEAMRTAVRRNIGNRTPKDEFLVPFIKKNIVAHIGAHLAYGTALNFRTDLGENRSLIPHPTRQTLLRESVKPLIDFAVPLVLYDVVMKRKPPSPEKLHDELGNYAEDPDIIAIQRMLAEALAGADEEREKLLSELKKTQVNYLYHLNSLTRNTRLNIRKLGLKRAMYTQERSEYEAALERIFSTLKRPAPAQEKHTS